MTKKNLFSLLLAGLLLIIILPVTAMAEQAIITASVWNNDTYEQIPDQTYSTIDAAAAAAGAHGKVSISAGACYFNGRQTISVPDLILEGAGSDLTVLYASSSFSSTSDTNKKALLTIGADGVTVCGLTLDGSPYGDTLSQTDDFIVLRINEGDGVSLDDVAITGSLRTLLHVGTGNSTSSVTAENLVCDAAPKSLPSQLLDGSIIGVYADIEVNPGSSLTVESGTLDAFAKAERGAELVVPEEGHYELHQTLLGIDLFKIATTAKHFVESYNALRDSGQLAQLLAFKSLANAESEKILDMAVAAIAAEDGAEKQAFTAAFEEMLNDMIGTVAPDDLVQARDALETGIAPDPQSDEPAALVRVISQMIRRYLLPILQQISALFPISR